MRILVVEDETTLREQLAFQLKQRGYSVDAAADGEEGLFLGREYPMDLAIIDLGLPGISGIQLIRELRKLSRAFPILILTARDAWQDKVEGLESGADDYLTKPFHGEELMARVNATGEAFLSHTRLGGRYTIRLSIGNLRTERRHVQRTWTLIRELAAELDRPGA